MPWLLREGTVLAALDEPGSRRSKTFEGAVVVGPRRVVHTLGSPQSLDLAWCSQLNDADGAAYLIVRRIRILSANRICMPRPAYAALLIARGGSFERWALHTGERLEVRSP